MLVVFTGPSLPGPDVARRLPHASVRPPAGRGDVAQAVADGASAILLIDGGFAQRLAVAPGEIVAALRAGVAVTGAASLGAIRAAECRPAGMRASGAVAALYRFGVLRDDDEVAVATEPERGHRAVSLALVNVRFAVLAALRAGLLDRPRAQTLLHAARAEHFASRHWPGVFAAAGLDWAGELRTLCAGTDVKRRDAERAVAAVAGPALPSRPRALAAPEVRYPGHDPYLGRTPAELAPVLARWLASSGRYRRYWPEPPVDSEAAWSDLDVAHELEGELLRLHAAALGGMGAECAPARRCV